MESLVALSLAGVFFAGSLAAGAADPGFENYGKRLTSPDAVAKSHPGSFEVYIDGPTGYAFVNTPKGWKFIRKVSEPNRVASMSAPKRPL